MTSLERRRPSTGPPWGWGAVIVAIVLVIVVFGWRNGWYNAVPVRESGAVAAHAADGGGDRAGGVVSGLSSSSRPGR